MATRIDELPHRHLGPRRALGLILLCVAFALGCSKPAENSPRTTSGAPAASPVASAGPAIRVVALGDSLTAGLGLPPEDAYPSLLQARLRARGWSVDVINAGVSGDTSAGGLRRLDWSLDPSTRVLIVALGGNDGLRGLPPSALQGNLAAIIEHAQTRRVAVILAGMEAPPNLGRAYSTAFRQVYRDLAGRYHVALLPFLLDGVAGLSGLNQADGIHPNAAGARKVADNLWPLVEAAVRRAFTP
jgi:acyl-CoA thioesterase-1